MLDYVSGLELAERKVFVCVSKAIIQREIKKKRKKKSGRERKEKKIII